MTDLKDIISLKDLWASPEWKEASCKFTEDKVCEWCGKKAGDTYITKKGATRRLGLVPHHIEKHKWGPALRNQVKNSLFTEWWKDNRFGHGYDVPRALANREVRGYIRGMWAIDNLVPIQGAFVRARRKIIESYLKLDPKHIIILCTRCHYAREKGLLICPICKENYRKKKYPTCFSCSRFGKVTKEKEK